MKYLLVGLITACRVNESSRAEWSELAPDGRTLDVPPERRKDRKPVPHRVPLSTQAQAILKHIKGERRHIFESRNAKGVPVTKAAILLAFRVATGSKTVTVHGCRSAFSSWCAENGVNPEVREACLMHSMGTASAQAYQRSDLLDQRRALMQAWADEILPMDVLREALATKKPRRLGPRPIKPSN